MGNGKVPQPVMGKVLEKHDNGCIVQWWVMSTLAYGSDTKWQLGVQQQCLMQYDIDILATGTQRTIMNRSGMLQPMYGRIVAEAMRQLHE